MSRTVEPDASPSSMAADLRLVIGRIARRLRQEDHSGLTLSQLSALATLSRSGPLKLSDLAAREQIGAPAMTRLATSLEELDLIDRTTDPLDGRASLISLSTAGVKKLESIRQERTATLTKQLEALSQDDLATIETALPVLARLVSEDSDR